MTGNEYQDYARRTQNELLSEDSRKLHALTGLASEVGEIHSIFQHAVQHGESVDREALKDEIGDALWFICELCDCYYWSLENVMEMNIDKLRLRYPIGFDAERSVHRHELDHTEQNEE